MLRFPQMDIPEEPLQAVLQQAPRAFRGRTTCVFMSMFDAKAQKHCAGKLVILLRAREIRRVW